MIKAISDLCVAGRSICYGIVQPGLHTEGGRPILRVANLRGDRIDTTDVMCVDPEIEQKYKRSRIQENDVLVSLVGSLGQVAIAGKDVVGWNVARAVGVIPATDRHHAEWIRYSLQSREAQQFIADHANTTVQATFNLRDLSRLPIPYLDEDLRKGILSVLTSLDDKIELNRRMSATLEEMARALYRSWFVDFDPVHARALGQSPAHMDAATAALFPDSFGPDGLPKGWKAGTISDLADLNPEKWSKRTHPGAVRYLDLANVKWGAIDSVSDYLWDNAPSRARMALKPGDTIVGTVRPGNGSYALIHEDGLTGSTGFAVLRPVAAANAALLYCAATSPENIERLTNLADGAAYPAVRPEVVGKTQVALPSGVIGVAYTELATPWLNRCGQLAEEANTLAALRDTLLPRLMSGELRIRDAEKQVEEVL